MIFRLRHAHAVFRTELTPSTNLVVIPSVSGSLHDLVFDGDNDRRPGPACWGKNILGSCSNASTYIGA